MSNYVYGSSLSYRDYLQARSFEDAIRSEISGQTRSLIASSEQLEQEHFSLSRSLQATVSEGFTAVSEGLEQLSFDLQTLNAGVSELTAAFHWGMSELLVAVGRVNDTLADLVRIAKTPAQTWAYEQFEIARDAFRQELYPEALEYLNRAINGHVGNTGYKLEYRFHYLLGTIRLGSARNNSPHILNLLDAENAFLNSARYARRDEPNEAGRAFLAAGWAAYCQGKMDTAKQHTEQAVALFPALAEAHFQLAKIQMHTGEAEQALVPLRRAIELDRAYSIKAASDGDFRRHEARVQTLLKALRREAKERANVRLLAIQREAEETEKDGVQEYTLPKFTELKRAKRALDDAVSAIHVDTYFGYLDAFTFCERAKEALQHARKQFVLRWRTDIQEKISGIQQQVASTNAQIAEVNRGKYADKWMGLFIFGLVLSVVIGFVQCGRASGFEASFSALVSSAMFFGLVSAIVTFTGYQIQKGNALDNLNNTLATMGREKDRLESILVELQRREK